MAFNGWLSARHLSALGLSLLVIAAIGLQLVLNGSKPELPTWGTRVWDIPR